MSNSIDCQFAYQKQCEERKADHERYSTNYHDCNTRLQNYAKSQNLDWLTLKNELLKEADPHNLFTPKEQMDGYFKLVNEILEPLGF